MVVLHVKSFLLWAFGLRTRILPRKTSIRILVPYWMMVHVVYRLRAGHVLLHPPGFCFLVFSHPTSALLGETVHKNVEKWSSGVHGEDHPQETLLLNSPLIG